MFKLISIIPFLYLSLYFLSNNKINSRSCCFLLKNNAIFSLNLSYFHNQNIFRYSSKLGNARHFMHAIFFLFHQTTPTLCTTTTFSCGIYFTLPGKDLILLNSSLSHILRKYKSWSTCLKYFQSGPIFNKFKYLLPIEMAALESSRW